MNPLFPLKRIFAALNNASDNAAIIEHQEKIGFARNGIEYHRAIGNRHGFMHAVCQPVTPDVADTIIDNSQKIIKRLGDKIERRTQKYALN